MKIETRQEQQAAQRTRALRRGRQAAALAAYSLLLLALGGTATQLIVATLRPPEARSGPALGPWLRAPARYLRALTSGARVETLAFDIKFKHLHRIHQKRTEALRGGTLLELPGDLVPATITIGERSVPARVRLLGPRVDHLRGDAWSLRVHVPGDDHVFGMQRFTLQSPAFRGFERESLVLAHMKREGLVAPRTRFAEVTINGDELGLMAATELASAGLLATQGRSEGPIIRFDASAYWLSLRDNGRAGPFDNANTAPIVSAIARVDEPLDNGAAVAVGLLRGFLAGKIPAREAFDVEETARFLAVAEFWRASGAVAWPALNLRYDALRARLSPLGFLGDPATEPPNEGLVTVSSQFGSLLLDDPELRHRFVASLHRLAEEAGSGDLLEVLRAEQRRTLDAIDRSHPSYVPIDLNGLTARASKLRQVEAASIGPFEPSLAAGDFRYPAVVEAYLLEDSTGSYLELINALPVPVQVSTLRHRLPDGSASPILLSSAAAFPIELLPTPYRGRPTPVRIGYRAPNRALGSAGIEGVARVEGSRTDHRFAAIHSAVALDASPVPSASLDEALAAHPFLEWDPSSLSLRIPTGRYKVEGSLIVPAGLGLRIEAGTSLRFQAGQALVASGPLHFAGSKSAPILLTGPSSDKRSRRWAGIVLMSSSRPSRWSHVSVRGAGSVDRGGWQIPASVVFRKSQIELEHCSFRDSLAQASLAIVDSGFSLRDVEILESEGTGLAIDFSQGTIERGRIEGAGRNGVHLRNARVDIDGTRLSDIRQTGLAAADASELNATGIDLARASIAVAATNGSWARVRASELREIVHVPLVAYTDERSFGPARLEALNNGFDASDRLALAQTGSVIELDGAAAPSVDADFGQLSME